MFLDLDGTLLELSAHPETVDIPPALPDILSALERRLDGAVAIVSGRNIDVIDQLLKPFCGHAVGVHGLELRIAGQAVERRPADPLPTAILRDIESLAALFPGTILENKNGALAIHERGTEQSAADLFGKVFALCARHSPGWQCLIGHRVLEIKPDGVSKGTGVAWLMQHAGFADREPIAIGDDITDLSMFDEVRRLGGLTISVGDRITGTGQWQLVGPNAVIELLCRWIGSANSPSLADLKHLASDLGRQTGLP